MKLLCPALYSSVYNCNDFFLCAILQFVSFNYKLSSKQFVPLNSTPLTTKSKQKPCLKYFKSSKYSIKVYADDATLISDCLEMHIKVLQQIDQKAILDLDLSFKSSKCVSHLYDGNHHSGQGI